MASTVVLSVHVRTLRCPACRTYWILLQKGCPDLMLHAMLNPDAPANVGPGTDSRARIASSRYVSVCAYLCYRPLEERTSFVRKLNTLSQHRGTHINFASQLDKSHSTRNRKWP